MHPQTPSSTAAMQSPIHRLPAVVKLPCALGLLLMAMACSSVGQPGFIVLGAFLALIALLSRIPARFLLKRLLLLEPFALGVSCLAFFQPNGEQIFWLLLLRSTLCLATVVLLTATTPFGEMISALRRAHVPALMLTTLALMYRYLFVLVEERERMQRARLARTFSRQKARSWQGPAAVAARLFVRSSERAERIYAAMCARGWKS